MTRISKALHALAYYIPVGSDLFSVLENYFAVLTLLNTLSSAELYVDKMRQRNATFFNGIV